MTRELRHRDPLLFWTGAFMLLMLLVVTLISISDTRQILGLNPWIKPMKFMTSITIFLWTVAWFMPETQPNPLARAMVRWTIAIAMLTEITIITMQAARGTTSHFNNATAFDDILFGIMGLGVVFNTAAMVLFLWIIRRDTPPSRAGYIWGIRIGVAMFLLASFEGTLIVGNNAHTVGAPDGGAGLPFVNWSTQYGDLRVAHFVGMHAMQGLPILGFLLDRALRKRGDERSGSSIPRNAVIAAGILWFAVTGGLLFMALQGRPLLAL
ncbi:MAG TPA: hypothetical protein VFZ38_18505 [Vicinamibacterales bacterium]